MEEIDNIIIDSLRNLHCDIGDDIHSLKQFDADMVTSAVSTCLQAIDPSINVQKKLPPSMSLKLKIASNLAEHIKQLGFRGDMGYQTILYCNEVEVRRVLMFLIERLPRDASKVLQVEETGYVPRLVKNIEECVKKSLEEIWLPSNVLYKGTRPSDNTFHVNSLGGSNPLQSENLIVPDCSNSQNEALKNYYIHIVPEVTKQCNLENLLPSLLFKDNDTSSNSKQLKNVLSKTSDIKHTDNSLTEHTNILLAVNDADSSNSENIENDKSEDKIKALLDQLEKAKNNYITLRNTIKDYDLQLSKLKTMKSEEEEVLKNTLAKVKIKTKTFVVLSKEENKLKLKSLVDDGNERLIELANQWNEVQTPLLEEYKTLQNSLSSEELKQQQEQTKLNSLKETYNNLVTDLKEKDVLEQNLIKKCHQMNKTNNRSGYTRRIMEIIGNIKKQNEEIQKVLQDTKQVQKDINSLTGQVDRSFTLSDELIFRDARHDETARKAYKLLAALRDECGDIIKAVTDIGLVERESRNLQDQVDTESAKEMAVKLEKVLKDIEEIKKETSTLKTQKQQ